MTFPSDSKIHSVLLDAVRCRGDRMFIVEVVHPGRGAPEVLSLESFKAKYGPSLSSGYGVKLKVTTEVVGPETVVLDESESEEEKPGKRGGGGYHTNARLPGQWRIDGNEVGRLHSEGMNIAEIARTLRCDRKTVRVHLKKLRLETLSAEEHPHPGRPSAATCEQRRADIQRLTKFCTAQEIANQLKIEVGGG